MYKQTWPVYIEAHSTIRKDAELRTPNSEMSEVLFSAQCQNYQKSAGRLLRNVLIEEEKVYLR
jgi:hypothetical protein